MAHDSDLKFDPNDIWFSGSYLRTSILTNIVDRTQRSGRLVPVFGPPSREKEEEYIEKMIARDKKKENSG